MKVCGMMHLVLDHGKSSLHETLRNVYGNFTSIHTAITQHANQRRELGLRAAQCEFMWKMIEAIIEFCKCSLNWLVHEDGTINNHLANVLTDYEGKLLDFIDGLTSLSVPDSYAHLSEYYSVLSPDNILCAYVHDFVHGTQPSSDYQLLIDEDELMVEFIDHVVADLSADKHSLYLQTCFLKKTLTFLRKYVEFTAKDWKNAQGVDNKLLVSVYAIASRISWFSFFGKWYTNSHREEFIDQVPVDVSVRVLGVMILQLDDSSVSRPISDRLLLDYADCIRECPLELQKICEEANGEDQITKMISLEGVWYVAPFLICYKPENKSDIKVHFQALLRKIGCVIYSCFRNQKNRSKEENVGLFDLISKLNHIQEEIMRLLSACVISDIKVEEYPETHLVGLLIFIFGFLKKLVDGKSDLITGQLDDVRQNLLLSISLLKNIENNIRPNLLLSISLLENIKENNLSKALELLITGYNASFGKENNKQIHTLIGKLMFLSNFLELDVINGGELKNLLISAQVFAFNIARYFLQKRCGNTFHWWRLYSEKKNRVVDSHVRVGILRALVLSLKGSSAPPFIDERLMGYVECIQDNILELLKNKAVIHPLKHQLEILHQNLSFSMHLLFTYPPMQGVHNERSSEIKLRVHALVKDLGFAIYLYYDDLQTKGKIGTDRFAYLIEMLNDVREETVRSFPLIIFSGMGKACPEPDPFGFFSILLENWKEFIERKSDLFKTGKDEFRTILENLFHFRSFFQKVKNNTDVESQRLCNRIIDAGYVAEYLLSSFDEGYCPDWCIPLWRCEFAKHIKLIDAAVNEKNDNGEEIMDAAGKDHKSQVPRTTNATSLDPNNNGYSQALQFPTSTDVFVGFQVEMDLIRKQLAGFKKHLDVISIIGMPGLGKTTLARKVYEDPYIVNHFDVRAWCSVSKDYNKKSLFLIILSCLTEITDLISRMSETKLSVMVQKQLRGRKYFIVLDDIRELGAFMEFKLLLPDDSNGSRIMLISRSKEIGLGASCSSDPIELDPLTDEESWDLLKHKVYGRQECPKELRQVGKEIARRCRGLPLSVVVVAGFLSKSINNVGFWEQILGSLSSSVANNSQPQWMAVLELSYKNLPDFLKPLFLYFGSFPEDKKISVSTLMSLWIAEGLVHKTESRSLEIQAKLNLMDLIDRNLVATKKSTSGRVKACYVRGLLRDMCLAKAKEDNFMQHITVSAGNEILDVAYQHRISVILKRDTKTFSKPVIRMLNPPVRTLLSFSMNEHLNPVFSSLKLLRVFHSEGTTLSSDASDGIVKFVHLRYISIQTVWKIIPPSISCISTLETLIIKGTRGEIVVPNQIWKMFKLRHLHINPRASFKTIPNDASNLDNLITFSTPVINLGEEEKFIRKVPNIQKLRCIFTEGTNLSKLESLRKLESLKISYHGVVKFTGAIELPLTLKKLSLSKFRLTWSEISMFHNLPNLEVLKLRDDAVQDGYWSMEDDDVFCNLKVLKLENLNIKSWIADACSLNFPSLEKLVLERCMRLEEIPFDLGEIESLRKIEVLGCNQSAAKSVTFIQEDQEVLGNYSLKIHIVPSPQEEYSPNHPFESENITNGEVMEISQENITNGEVDRLITTPKVMNVNNLSSGSEPCRRLEFEDGDIGDIHSRIPAVQKNTWNSKLKRMLVRSAHAVFGIRFDPNNKDPRKYPKMSEM